MGTDALGFMLALLAIGVTIIAFRSTFPLMKYGASLMWLLFLLFGIENIGEPGSPLNSAVIPVGIFMMVVPMLAQLGRSIKKERNMSDGFKVSSEGFSFKMPDWMQNQDSQENVSRRRQQSNDEYRETLHRALNPRKRR